MITKWSSERVLRNPCSPNNLLDLSGKGSGSRDASRFKSHRK